eukprot:5750413-Pyramimonas_sp.AAC.1
MLADIPHTLGYRFSAQRTRARIWPRMPPLGYGVVDDVVGNTVETEGVGAFEQMDRMICREDI